MIRQSTYCASIAIEFYEKMPWEEDSRASIIDTHRRWLDSSTAAPHRFAPVFDSYFEKSLKTSPNVLRMGILLFDSRLRMRSDHGHGTDENH